MSGHEDSSERKRADAEVGAALRVGLETKAGEELAGLSIAGGVAGLVPKMMMAPFRATIFAANAALKVFGLRVTSKEE